MAPAKNVAVVGRVEESKANFGGNELMRMMDPQQALSKVAVGESGFHRQAAGTPGHRTVFALVRQGRMTWWQPVQFEIRAEPAPCAPYATDWRKPRGTTKFEAVHLESLFNDKVTQIY